MLDTLIKIHLLNGDIVHEGCNYKILLQYIEDESDFLILKNNIIPKINIKFIQLERIEESEEK